MREILFRGKDIRQNWHIGLLAHIGNAWYISNKAGIATAFEVIPETVGEYTNLIDKNYKKIFEGDIFKFPDEIWESCYTSCGTEYDSWTVENYGVVGFREDTGRFDFIKYKFDENSVEADLHENHNIEFCEFVSDLEIVGNIHDNPELLGSEQE